jgi:hypothetical protein
VQLRKKNCLNWREASHVGEACRAADGRVTGGAYSRIIVYLRCKDTLWRDLVTLVTPMLCDNWGAWLCVDI